MLQRDRQEICNDFVVIEVGTIRATVNRSTSFIPNRLMLGYDAIGFDVRE